MPPKDKPAPKKPEPEAAKAATAKPAAPADTPPAATGTKKDKTGNKKDKTGTKKDKTVTPQPSVQTANAPLPKELYCTPETCMYQPGRCSKWFDKNQHKLKYFMAALLFASLVICLVIYIMKCKNKKKTK